MLDGFAKLPLKIDDEQGRLRALQEYDILGQEDGALFDDLVALASNLGEFPIAFVSIVDGDKQWLRSARGITAKQTPRQIAFCDHAIRQDTPMVVPDTHLDPRFSDNPLVTGSPHLRFYAGAPIVTAAGYAVGTICLADTSPREHFEHAGALAALARQASILIEMRKQLIERQRAAEMAVDQRDRLWDNSLDMMVVVQPGGRILAANPSWINRFGNFDHHGDTNIVEYFDDSEMKVAAEVADGQSDVRIDRKMRSKDDELIFINWSLARENDLVFGIGRDVTQSREAEARLAQAQRLESLGQLTGGIAHDFNNLLTIVLGNLEIAKRRLGDNERQHLESAIDNAREGAQRAATLTQRLLAFARRQSLTPVTMSPADLVEGLRPLVLQALDERFELEIDVEKDIPAVRIDAGQLENAILNLVVNARDAMEDEGKVRIEVSTVEIERRRARRHDIEPGKFVSIAITDNGAGIPDAIASQIFEPFFTTKETGKGTGLGLSQVQGFIAQSGGFVAMHTRSGEGTTFTIHLPATDAPTVLPGAGNDDAPNTDYSCDLSGRTILVVEDNADLRSHVAELLVEEGMDVRESADGEAALAYLIEADTLPDMVLSDVTMPKMTGTELARHLTKRFPELPMLLMTGYAREELGPKNSDLAVLKKPFSPVELVEAIRSCLAHVEFAATGQE